MQRIRATAVLPGQNPGKKPRKDSARIRQEAGMKLIGSQVPVGITRLNPE